MNCVGAQGKGESVWLGFFLYDVLERFAELARRHGDLAFAERCQSEAAQLRRNIEASGWDGQWYRRAYFDDGTPLGSASSPECQIDSIRAKLVRAVRSRRSRAVTPGHGCGGQAAGSPRPLADSIAGSAL